MKSRVKQAISALSLFICLFPHSLIWIFKKDLFIFRERGREGEREGEKHHVWLPLMHPLTRDLAYNPGMCPDW